MTPGPSHCERLENLIGLSGLENIVSLIRECLAAGS